MIVISLEMSDEPFFFICRIFITAFLSVQSLISRCYKLIAIILCDVRNLHFKVRRVSVAGYTTDKTLK